MVRHSATQNATETLSGQLFHFDTNVETTIRAEKERLLYPYKADTTVLHFSMGIDVNVRHSEYNNAAKLLSRRRGRRGGEAHK